MRLLAGHAKAVRSVAYLPDGRLVSGGDDRTVRVWDAAGACERVFKAARQVNAVAAAPDGRMVAFGGRPTDYKMVAVGLWDPAGDGPAGSHRPSVVGSFYATRSVWSLAFTADGRFVLAGCRCALTGNSRSGYGVFWWSQDGSASGEYGPTAHTVRADTGGAACAVTFSGAVEVYSAPDRPPSARVELGAGAAEVVAVAFLPGDRLAAVAGGWLLVFDPTARRPRRVRTGIARLAALAAHPDGRTVLVGGSPGGVERYDAVTGERVAAFDFGVGKVHGLAFAPDGHTFAVAGQTGLAVCDWE